MHEMSIVENLINLCEKNLNASKGKIIKDVYIKIGRLSGVETHYLKSCYDVFKEGTVCENASLHIHKQEVVIKCDQCGFEGILEENHFVCPKCNNKKIKVIDGEDMYLMKIEME